MLSEMTARQFDEWQAFYQLDPWGEERADMRAAMLTSRIYNALRDKNGQGYTVYDFLLWTDRPPPPTEEELEGKLMAAFGFTPDGQRLENIERGNSQPNSGESECPDGAV